nr:MAG TPA: RNAseH-like protein [Caudoviricetes sp.]
MDLQGYRVMSATYVLPCSIEYVCHVLQDV